MKRDDIEKLADLFEAETLDANENLLIQCPFAPWTHKKGRDRTPSLSIKINDAGNSPYHCFGCEEEGATLDVLLFRLDDYGYDRERIREIRAFIESAEIVGGGVELVTGEYDRKPDPIIRMAQPPPPDLVAVMENAQFRKSYSAAYEHEYLKKRGIMRKTAELFDIRYDAMRDMIVLPVRWYTGELVGAKGRGVHSRDHYNYWRFPKSLCLFGEHLLRPEPVVVCEGEFDAMKVVQAGFNCVSVMGAKFSVEQANKLVEWDQDVVIFFDNDEVGHTYGKKLSSTLKALGVSTQVVMPPEGSDAGDLSTEDIQALLSPLLRPDELVSAPLPSHW